MADKKFVLKIITPEKVFMDEEVTMVEFTTSEGDMGVYANHAPETSIVVPCVIQITNDGVVKYAAINSGFVEVVQDRVTILTETAESPEDINIGRAEKAKERAERRIQERKDNIDYARAEASLKRALTRISLSERK